MTNTTRQGRLGRRAFLTAAVATPVVAGVGGALAASAAGSTTSVPYASTPVKGWHTNGVVYAVKIVGDVVYIGGKFTQVVSRNGTVRARKNLAALTLSGAEVTSFRADTDATVRALEASSSTLYVGGAFTTVDGVARKRLAAVDLATGEVSTQFVANTTSTVYALALTSSALYVGGAFGQIKGKAVPKLAKVDPGTGAVRTAFAPSPDDTVMALAVSGTTLYAGGQFSSIGGKARPNLSGLSVTTGRAIGKRFSAANATVWGLDVNDAGTMVFAALGGLANRAVALKVSTGALVWRKIAMGDVQAVRYRDGVLYFGFHEGYRGNAKRHLMAVSAAKGTLLSYHPPMKTFYGVWAIDVTADALVIGGDFTTVNKVKTGNVAVFQA